MYPVPVHNPIVNWIKQNDHAKAILNLSFVVGHYYETETENESKLSGIIRKSIGQFSIVKDIFNKARCKLYS